MTALLGGQRVRISVYGPDRRVLAHYDGRISSGYVNATGCRCWIITADNGHPRVIADGDPLIQLEALPEPYTTFAPLRGEDGRPLTAELLGIAPDWTAGRSVEEYLGEARRA